MAIALREQMLKEGEEIPVDDEFDRKPDIILTCDTAP